MEGISVVDRTFPDGLRNFYHAAVFVAEEAIPGTPIREGDIVLWLGRSRKVRQKEQRAIRGTLEKVPRKHFQTIAAHIDVLRHMESATYGSRPERFRSYMSNHKARRASAHTNPLHIVRPWASPVSDPIEASSDEGALFNLIADAGGRMPNTED